MSNQLEKRDRSKVIVAVAVLAFIGIGLPEGSLGVTFPAIRETFDQPLSALGLLLYPFSGGYIFATLSHGRLLSRAGTARLLMGAAGVASIGAVLYAVGPTFAVLMVGTLFLGVSSGALDVALNSYASVHLPHRVLAFMHAGFGIGATLGPLGVTALLQGGASWRVAYAVLGVVQIAIALAWFGVRHDFRTMQPTDWVPSTVVGFEGDLAEFEPAARSDSPVSTTAPPRLKPPLSPRRHRWVRYLNISMFFLYTGTEGSTGILIATLLVSRGLDVRSAGLLTTAYWGALTVGRIATGVVGPRLEPARALIGSVLGAVGGLALVWLGGTGAAAVGLLVVGLSLAPIFPSLVALTPSRVGVAKTSSAIGYQLAAASFGVATIPALVGILADKAGAEVIAPALFLVGLALAADHFVTAVVARDLRGFR